MNAHLINELKQILLHYLRETEVLQLRLEVSSLNSSDKALILKTLTLYNTKIATISYSLETSDNKFKYSKN